MLLWIISIIVIYFLIKIFIKILPALVKIVLFSILSLIFVLWAIILEITKISLAIAIIGAIYAAYKWIKNR